mmetsp:Transcript_127141/g.245148  ORF Transcript_127141/g.245148 Transcript_127141/m.245148 type:complete len:316 (+) Transcript_127141:54-1001(+)
MVLRSFAAAGAAYATMKFLPISHWSTSSRTLLLMLAAYLPSYLDGAEKSAAKRRSRTVSQMVQLVYNSLVPMFFNVQPAVLEDPDRLNSCKQYILAIHPHGVLSLDHLLTISAFDAGLEKALPQAQRSPLSAGILFKIPLIRELLLSVGGVDAGRKTAEHCLKKGLSLSVVPGGEREQLLAQRGPVESIILKHRQGFIRLALKFGVPIIPVFCFGEGQLYHQSKFLMGFRSWVQRTLGMALVMPYGAGGIPLKPFNTPPLRLVVGAPVDMPKVEENPLPKDVVDEHHSRYIAAVEALFAKHKVAMGYEDITLQIL